MKGARIKAQDALDLVNAGIDFNVIVSDYYPTVALHVVHSGIESAALEAPEAIAFVV